MKRQIVGPITDTADLPKLAKPSRTSYPETEDTPCQAADKLPSIGTRVAFYADACVC